MKTTLKFSKQIALIACLCLLFAMLSGCKGNKDFPGNMSDIRDPEPGDVYAVVTLKGFEGEMTFVLFEEIAPVGVRKFIRAAETGYYNGKTFHRVLKDMMVQGGALNLDGSDISVPQDELFDIETHKNARNFFGALCFAPDPKSGKNYRQFYIVTASKSVDIDADAALIKEMLEEKDEELLPDAQRKELDALHKHITKIPAPVKDRYEKSGGLYRFDDNVTVFGQLITGHELLEVVSKVEVVAGNKLDDNNKGLNNGQGQHSRPANEIFIETIRIVRIEEPEE